MVIKIKNVSDFDIFLSGYQNSHSYRIPSLLKLKSGTLIAIVDQRVESQLDAPYTTINQILRSSNDNGLTWLEGRVIISLEKTRDSKASAIDSVIVEDENDQTLYLAVDIYPGGSGLMPIAKLMNPLGTSDLGFAKYKKLFKTDSNLKMILKPLDSSGWFRAYEILDGDWENHSDSNHKPLNILVNNTFNKATGLLHGGVYVNVFSPEEALKAKPICSIFDGFDNRNPNYNKPEYYLESTSYLYLFKSKDEGKSWELIQDITQQIKRNNSNMNSLVLGPGKGLFLKNQKNGKNNRLIFPFYEVNYALPLHAYFGYSDDSGLNWNSSEYINPQKDSQWHWLSETQVIENSDGSLYAYSRNPEQNQICVSRSLDSGHTWIKLDSNDSGFSIIKHQPLNAQIMHGLTNFVYKNNDYHLLSLPTTIERKNGQLFLIDKNWNLKLIYEITAKNSSFGYSAIQILEQKSNQVTIGILYEVSKIRNQALSWVGFDSESTENIPDQSEILFKKLTIEFEN